jgi:hypothetical protein
MAGAPSVLTETGCDVRGLAKDATRQLQPKSLLVLECPFLTMVPVMAVSDLVAPR